MVEDTRTGNEMGVGFSLTVEELIVLLQNISLTVGFSLTVEVATVS